MKTLWFKAEFVAAIMAGSKRDTIRRSGTRLPRVGDTVAFSVGPRRPFATAKIIAVEDCARESLAPSRAAQVAGCYGDSIGEPMTRVVFEVLQAPGEGQ